MKQQPLSADTRGARLLPFQQFWVSFMAFRTKIKFQNRLVPHNNKHWDSRGGKRKYKPHVLNKANKNVSRPFSINGEWHIGKMIACIFLYTSVKSNVWFGLSSKYALPTNTNQNWNLCLTTRVELHRYITYNSVWKMGGFICSVSKLKLNLQCF